MKLILVVTNDVFDIIRGKKKLFYIHCGEIMCNLTYSLKKVLWHSLAPLFRDLENFHRRVTSNCAQRIKLNNVYFCGCTSVLCVTLFVNYVNKSMIRLSLSSKFFKTSIHLLMRTMEKNKNKNSFTCIIVRCASMRV